MVQLRRMSFACVVVSLCVVGGPVAVAADSAVEAMIKVAPDETIVLVAMAGGDTAKGDFEKSIIGRIWNDPGVRSFAGSIKTQLMAKAQQEAGDPNEMKQIDMAMGLAQLAASRPIVCGLAQLKGPTKDKEIPPVCGFAILDAGTRKAEFEGLLKQVESLAGTDGIVDVNVGSAKMRGPKDKPPVPLYWGWSGNYLVVAVNDADGTALQYLQKPRATVTECFTKTPGGGNAIVLHATIEKAVAIADAFLRQVNEGQVADVIAAALRELGLSGVKTFTMRAGFDGANVIAGSYVEAPAPRKGLPALSKPMDPAMLDMVDARAVSAGAANLDIAGVYDTILRTVKAVAGEHFADVEKGLAAFEAGTQVSVRKGLLESLAGPVVFYSTGMGTMAEAPMGGLVAIVRLKDAALFEKTMTSLGTFVAAQSKGMLQVGSQARDDGRTVHNWVIPQLAMTGVSPTWSIEKGCAVIGSSTAMYDAAVRQITSSGGDRKSIRDAAGYKEIASRLPANLTSLHYTDSRVQYTQAMAMLQQFWPMAAMFAGQGNFKLPPTLPSLGHIIQAMKPSGRWSWTTPDGLYTEYRGDGIEASLASVAGASIGVAVTMPALARARDQARIVRSTSNLQKIYLALTMYADDNDGTFPADLQELGKYLLDATVFESPRKPKGFTGPNYIYVVGQKASMDAGNILVYENPEFSKDRILVLFMNCHVKVMKPEEFHRELQETCERLGRPMPEVRFKDEAEIKPQTSVPVPSPSM